MPILKGLTNLLEKNKIKYEIVKHKTVYTALDKARTLHVDPKRVVKSAVLKLDTRSYALALISADNNLDKVKFKKVVNKWRKKQGEKAVKKVDFVTERWMKKNIPGKLGATPALGELLKMSTFVDIVLLRQPRVYINTGDYEYSLELTRARFEKALGKDVIKGSFSKAKKKRKRRK